MRKLRQFRRASVRSVPLATDGVKISELPAASAAGLADQLEVNQAGTSRRLGLDMLVGTVVVINLAALKAIDPAATQGAVRTASRTAPGDNGGGDWTWLAGDQAASVAADPASGIWAAPASDPTGSSGAWKRSFTGPVIPHWYGPIGAGADTATIQTMLSSPEKRLHFPAGSYTIVDPLFNGTAVLLSSLAGRKITCDGTLTAASKVKKLLQVTGDGTDIQINIDGNNFIADGLRIVAAGCAVHDSSIHDLYSAANEWSCFAVYFQTNGECVFRNNNVKRITSVGDGTLGNGVGQSAAVVIIGTDHATGDRVIEGCIIEDILGQEGDAINVGAFVGALTHDIRLSIRNSSIRNFTRRAIKMTGSNVNIDNMTFSQTFTDPSQMPNGVAVVDAVEGGNIRLRNSTFNGCKWRKAFSVSGNAVGEYWIEDNRILGIGAETDDGQLFVSPGSGQAYGYIRRNHVTCGTGYAIIANLDKAVVEDNNIWCADNPALAAISLSGSIDGFAERNRLFSGVRHAVVESNTEITVAGNHARADTAIYRNDTAGNSIVINNTHKGAAGVSGGSPSPMRAGNNFQMGNQSSRSPGPIYTNTTDPAAAFPDLYFSDGQIVFSSIPDIIGYTGWIATAAGLGSAIPWKPFGMLDDVLMVYGGTGATALAASGTEYLTAQGVMAPNATEINAQAMFIPRDIRLQRLRATLQNAPGTGNSRTFTLRRGGVDTAATVTIADASKGASWTGDLVLAANGSLSISSTVTGTASAARATFSLEYVVVAGAAGMVDDTDYLPVNEESEPCPPQP